MERGRRVHCGTDGGRRRKNERHRPGKEPLIQENTDSEEPTIQGRRFQEVTPRELTYEESYEEEPIPRRGLVIPSPVNSQLQGLSRNRIHGPREEKNSGSRGGRGTNNGDHLGGVHGRLGRRLGNNDLRMVIDQRREDDPVEVDERPRGPRREPPLPGYGRRERPSVGSGRAPPSSEDGVEVIEFVSLRVVLPNETVLNKRAPPNNNNYQQRRGGQKGTRPLLL